MTYELKLNISDSVRKEVIRDIRDPDKWLKEEREKTDFKKIDKIGEIAKSLNITQTQLSILWCLNNKNVSSVILGASSIEQLKENLETISKPLFFKIPIFLNFLINYCIATTSFTSGK